MAGWRSLGQARRPHPIVNFGVQQVGRNGTGVKKASHNSIEISFQYDGRRCRERLKLEPTAANLEKARRHRDAIQDAITNGNFDYAVTFPNSKNIEKYSEPKPLTLGGHLDNWLTSKKPQVKASTYTGYAKIVRFVGARIGNIPLIEFRRRHAAEFAAGLTCGNKRIGNLLSPVRSALDEAVHLELIETNPLKDWSYKKVMPPRKPPIDPFTREEQAEILAMLDGQNLNLITFAFWTGLRTSELCALEWGDIDWNRQVVRVDKARTQDSDEDETTKTLASIRDVKLLPPALAAIKAQKGHTFLEGCKVFHNPRTGQPWEGDQAIRKTCWRPAIKKAGVRYRKPYQTRHTFASMCLSAGENLAWVSRMLGHANVMQTARAYATWIPDTSPDAGLKMAEMFGGNVVINVVIPGE